MNSEGSWGSPKAEYRGNIDTSGIDTFVVAKICPFDASRAQDHGAYCAGERDCEIGRQRKCARSRGQCRETAFSRSRPRGARREGPRTAANRTGGSNPARFLCYIKDLLAVQAVSSEPVSGSWEVEFPVKQGKKQGISTYLANMVEFSAESTR